MVRDNRELKAKLNIIGQLQLTIDGTLKESLWILVLEVESLKIFGGVPFTSFSYHLD
jgi:hypothetical protein